ncbi:hypothetical protein GCM10027435_15070 [Haloparvum alkalitolerans]|uniref:hypothetical protein n=1 Tax=Haloparvum alkalitolerans TaxID=1042953 RepID=UPI003CE7B07F
MSSRQRGPDPVDDRLVVLALPAVLGMALGLAVGGQLDSLAAGIALGIALAAGFGWLRLWLANLPQ